MAKITIVFGVLLGLLGVGSFVATGSHAPTALIPLWVGLVMILSGILASSEDAGKRKLWMHVAVTIGLLGFIAAAIHGGMGVAKAGGFANLAHPIAVYSQVAMAAICLVFVVLCVRSFIAARRSGVV